MKARARVLALALLSTLTVGCQKAPSRMEGKVQVNTGSTGGSHPQLMEAVKKIETRLAALEASHQIGADGKAGPVERLHRIEATLARSEEALGFLDAAYGQQKARMQAQEANEPDPDAIFAVDFSKALAAGQFDGPANATVNIVEAWDFG